MVGTNDSFHAIPQIFLLFREDGLHAEGHAADLIPAGEDAESREDRVPFFLSMMITFHFLIAKKIFRRIECYAAFMVADYQ